MNEVPTPAVSGTPTSLLTRLKKNWYLVVLAILILAGLIYLGKINNVKPQTLLRDYGYIVILLWTFLEGETIVIVAGMFADSVELNPWLIALCAFIGSFISDQLMFSLGKYKGESVLQRFPRMAKNVDRAAALFKKYDIALILGFRFVYGVRNVTPILLGISTVSHRKFFFLNMIGASVWALTFTFGGYYSGKTFMHLMTQVGHGIFYAIVACIVLAGAVIFLRRRKHKKQQAAEAAAAADSPHTLHDTITQISADTPPTHTPEQPKQ